MTNDPFAARGQSFEDAYFHKKDKELVSKLQKVFQTKLTKDELRKASGVENEEVLDRLVSLNLRGELLGAFKLYPLVEVAWADGGVDKKEIAAVVKAAIQHGMPQNGEAIKRLEEWLVRGPTADGRAAWNMFAGELRKQLTPAQLNTFRADLLKMANDVAQASGGILGGFFQVSPQEKRVLDGIAKALTHP